MCLIVKSPGAVIPGEWLKTSVDHNPDGFGAMWFDRAAARVRSHKMQGTAAAQLEAYEGLGLTGVPHAIHHRFATTGNKTLSMCHPFQVFSKERNGMDLYLMHNGVLSGVKTPMKGNSDTWHFVKDFLRPALRDNPRMLRNKGIKKLLTQAIGTTNKLLFLDSDGVFTTINKSAGIDREVFWLSNTYSLNGTYRSSNPGNTSGTSYYHQSGGMYGGAGHGYQSSFQGNANQNVLALPPPKTSSIALLPGVNLPEIRLQALKNIDPKDIGENVYIYNRVARIFNHMSNLELENAKDELPEIWATYVALRGTFNDWD